MSRKHQINRMHFLVSFVACFIILCMAVPAIAAETSVLTVDEEETVSFGEQYFAEDVTSEATDTTILPEEQLEDELLEEQLEDESFEEQLEDELLEEQPEEIEADVYIGENLPF